MPELVGGHHRPAGDGDHAELKQIPAADPRQRLAQAVVKSVGPGERLDDARSRRRTLGGIPPERGTPWDLSDQPIRNADKLHGHTSAMWSKVFSFFCISLDLLLCGEQSLDVLDKGLMFEPNRLNKARSLQNLRHLQNLSLSIKKIVFYHMSPRRLLLLKFFWRGILGIDTLIFAYQVPCTSYI